MVLDLVVEAEGFALRLHADRPPGEILAGLLGCHRAVSVSGAASGDPSSEIVTSAFATRLHVDGALISGETWVSTLVAAIKLTCSKFGPDDHLELFVRGQLEALAQQEGCLGPQEDGP